MKSKGQASRHTAKLSVRRFFSWPGFDGSGGDWRMAGSKRRNRKSLNVGLLGIVLALIGGILHSAEWPGGDTNASGRLSFRANGHLGPVLPFTGTWGGNSNWYGVGGGEGTCVGASTATHLD